MPQTPEQRRAKAAKRQAERVTREKALGRSRRPYFATDQEHAALDALLTRLRSLRRKSDLLVAAPEDVLPEFRATLD